MRRKRIPWSLRHGTRAPSVHRLAGLGYQLCADYLETMLKAGNTHLINGAVKG